MLSSSVGYAYAFSWLDTQRFTPLVCSPDHRTSGRKFYVMGTYQSLLERLATYASAVPNGQAYFKTFLRRLVENPGSVTVREIGLVSGLTQISPEDLLLLSLCWSAEDMDLELEEGRLGSN